MGVGETIGFPDALSSGAYVKAGMFVPLTGPLSTAALELAGATKAKVLEKGLVLLGGSSLEDLGVWEEEGKILELATADDRGAGAGVGVK
jgi:hypothetical protein